MQHDAGWQTDLDLPELLALCEHEVHVLVKRKHLPNQASAVVPVEDDRAVYTRAKSAMDGVGTDHGRVHGEVRSA